MSSSIALSQNTSQDSVKCFTYSQVRKIAKDLKRLEICDSITQNQELQIINFKEVLKTDEQIIQENNKRLLEVTGQLNKANLKLKISKRLSLFGVPISFGAGIFIGIILMK